MNNEVLGDIYAAPQSEVLDTKIMGETVYYAPSNNKFMVLMFFSLTIYNLYWFYKNWASLKIKQSLSVWPVPRAIFSIFFVTSLFTHISDDANEHNTSSRPNPAFWGVFFIIVVILGRILERTDPEGWLSMIGVLMVIPLYIFNKNAREVNQKISPDTLVNSKLTAWNWLLIALGTLFWVLLLFAFFLPESYLE